MMGNVVLFVDFLVDFSSQTRKDHLFPNGSIKKPNDYEVLNYGPRKFGNDVSGISKDRPSFT
jgi:hypothetical protein